jgi:hypothetical protein
MLLREQLKVAHPALNQQRDGLLRPDRRPEPGVTVRADKTRHQQGMPEPMTGGDSTRADRPSGALQGDGLLLRRGDRKQVIKVGFIDRLVCGDQDLGALAGHLDGIGRDVHPV